MPPQAHSAACPLSLSHDGGFNTKRSLIKRREAALQASTEPSVPFLHTSAIRHLASSRTRVRIPLRTFLFKELLARASYYKHVSLGPQDLDRSLGRHVRPYTETRQPIRPKDPAVPRGGECYKAHPGLGNRSIFYPGSSVGSTITLLPGSIGPVNLVQ